MKKPLLGLITALVTLVGISSRAQVSITSLNTSYTQNFNTLSPSGTASQLPPGWKLLESGSGSNTSYTADDGSGSQGNTYSYGSAANTERALGMVQTASFTASIGVQVMNNTGQTVSSITLSYTGEQWSCGQANRSDRLDFQYSTTATALNTGTWTDENPLDFTSPSVSPTGKKDGNAAANRKAVTATISGLTIAPGTACWFRWSDFNTQGADDGLAIDDLSLTFHGAADTIPPALSATIPAHNAGGVALAGLLRLSFNEPVLKGTGTIVIRRTVDGKVIQITDVASPGVVVSGETVTLPYSGLSGGQAYHVEVSAGCFSDRAGNYFTGLCGAGSWGFSTGAGSGSGDTLTVMNWNVEWFGHTGNGPANDALQEQNVRKLLENTKADVFALSEMVSIPRLQNIVNSMPGYALVVSDFAAHAPDASSPEYPNAQKLAFVYRTGKVTPIRSYGVLRAGGSPAANSNWSSGRYPFLMETDVRLNYAVRRIVFVLIHGKANTADFVASYNRRKDGAAELRDSLNVQYPNSNFIILGDFNDDLDRTITTQVAPDTSSSYFSLLSQPDRYTAVTLPLSLAKEKSTVSHNEVIDHVILSNEMNRYYVAPADILRSEAEGLIPNFGSTTSDHYPVVTRYWYNSSSPQ